MKKQRIWAAVMTAVMMMFIHAGLFGGDVSAESTEETFTITNYDTDDNVIDMYGNVIPGHTYCLDSKATFPHGENFTRMPLSEAADYLKNDQYPRVFSDDVRSRLLKAVIAKDDILAYMNTVLASDEMKAHKQWFIDHMDELWDNGQISEDRTVSGNNYNYGELRNAHNAGSVSDSNFEKYKRWLADDIQYEVISKKAYQRLIWVLVHSDDDRARMLADDGKTTGDSERYCFEERHNYFIAYAVKNPIDGSAEHSMWTALYQPVVDYIDQLPDYSADGWDAWVYYVDDAEVQNILAAPFKPVFIEKADADGKIIAGAQFEITDASGNIIDKWTSDESAHKVYSVIPGKTYTLKETKAPDGYIASGEDIEFSVDSDYNIDTQSTLMTVSGNSATIANKQTSINISKVDITDSKEIEGAHIQIIDGDDTIIDEWDSTSAPHNVTGLLTGKTYTLRETVAPEGYALTSDTTFTLKADGTVDKDNSTASTDDSGVILVQDSRLSVKISKVDIADGKELEGAHIQVLDGEKIVEEWDSTTVSHEVKGLIADKTYTLRETVAPEGYTVTTDITFSVDSTGKVTTTLTTTTDNDGNTVLLIQDAKTTVSVKKTDGDTDETLAGAYMVIVDPKGKTVDTWTTGDNTFVVRGLVPGTYIIRELDAPDGYTIAEDICFTIGTDGKITTDAEMKDDVIIVKDYKVDIESDSNSANTNNPTGGTPIAAVGTDPTAPVARTGSDTPAPALVATILPDGTKKTNTEEVVSDNGSSENGGSDDGIVREDTDENLEEVDSGASLSDSGERRTETGVFAVICVMAIAFAAAVISRKRT